MNQHSPLVRAFATAILFGTIAAGWTPSAWGQDPAPMDPFPDSILSACPPAPAPGPLYLKKGDRLAICGDSITEQKIYSRLIETYLTVCVPDLKVTVRQYGWSGETAEGFLRRMTNDCLRFKPTIATTCYGMNDFKYRPYDDANGTWYEERYAAVAQAFKAADARVVLGSAGCVGKVASWVKTAGGTVVDHNASLARFRNHALAIAEREGVRFADVFRPLVIAGREGRRQFGPDFAIAGKDGVHPGGAGHLVMAYAYLKAMGLDGDLGAIRVDLKAGKAEAAGGHRVDGVQDGVVTLTSHRYPFCVNGSTNTDDSIRAGAALVPFHADLNRLTLIVRNGTAARYRITWGTESRSYAAARLAEGVNLAGEFAVNPFSEAFVRVDAAVGAKQAYETEQIKKIFHGPEGKADMEAAVKRTEEIRAPLATAIETAFVPVTHTLKIEAE
jgi:lysophospholipase L1-like esterase